ncbi:UDP-glucosyltransferase 2 [Halyomorpha halys]|uniref:UDP-glucosyltransferase 2 n=1 Tax=Halyomorpha halys TaxID=286706 RepID=UPI0006D4E00E|nr:UDP-glucuronosyltransferase 1-9 [Halyomorpha halys]
MKWLLLLFLTGTLYVEVSPKRILAFFPLIAKSHHYVFRPIIEELTKRGHEIVYVTGYAYEKGPPKGVTQIDIKKYLPFREAEGNVTALIGASAFDSTARFYKFGVKLSHMILSSPPVKELIHSKAKFDAVLMESYAVQEYQSAFIHKFGCVGIEIIPLGDFSWMNEIAGLPSNPSYQLDFKSEATQDMNFIQRLYNTYVVTITTLISYYQQFEMQRIVDQYFTYPGWETRPPLSQLLANRSLILSNSHFAIGYPSPLTSHRKEIGGVNILPNKPLSKDLQKYMDESTDGVIYFSLGSNINVSDPLNEHITQVFINTFRELPYKVLMKWEIEYTGTPPPPNVKLEKWFPQQDILAHKNCILFITHGGLLSLMEAVHFGVPVIGIPFFGDQAKNFFFAEEAGIGKMIRLEEITYERVSNTIKEVLSNKSYKNEIMKKSKIFRDRPEEPVKTAVYWIEHAMKYPNVLTPKSASLSYVQLHLLDVKLFLGTVLLTALYIIWKLLASISRLFKGKPAVRKAKRS